MSATVRLRDRPLWFIGAVIGLARDWLARFVAVQGFDRAMSVSAYAYTALFPLLIVYSTLLPRTDNKDFADRLIETFDLTGSAAASVKLAFAPAGTVQSGVTLLGVFLLLYSALSFSRNLQRLFEFSYGLPTLGMRNTPRALMWLAFIGVLAALRPVVTSPFDGWLKLIETLGISTFGWVVTPYLLLGRRVGFKRLLPGAALTAIGMGGVAVWAAIWMPRTFAASAAQFGIIGIGFAVMSFLFAASVVLVVATTGGAMIGDRWTHWRSSR